ncbi:MAG: hypothetical protein HN778_00305 [Prolixibacteraceae bacterium]|jgi:hypothetical protein|nr:hypothetical protein [Prolixibacteraceae bacterium]MBT6763393.1 hypothetical protein [Prolixibacteraceae bacterium]MBT6999902.1 hypothetical protein [Prolixibacteraceae bacterium]MBT7393252.1 hypothetical protein [Prolixibacteraceae bacterium]
MNVIDENVYIFEGKLGFEDSLYLPEFRKNEKKGDNQEFVVPWQMTDYEKALKKEDTVLPESEGELQENLLRKSPFTF